MFRVDTTRMDEDKTQLSLNASFEVRQWMVTTTPRSPRCPPAQGAQLEITVRRGIYVCCFLCLSEIFKPTRKPLLTRMQSGVRPAQPWSVLQFSVLKTASSSDCVRTVCQDSRSLAKCPPSAKLMQGTALQCTHAVFTTYQTVDSFNIQ